MIGKLKRDLQQLDDLEMSQHLLALGEVLCRITWETLERTPIPFCNWVHPYQPGDEVWVKDWKKEPLQPVWTGLTWSSWQPLLLLKLQASSLASTTPESRRQWLPAVRTPGKQFGTPKIPLRSGSKNNSRQPRRTLSPAVVTPEADSSKDSRSLRILQPCSSHTPAAGWSMHGGSLRIRLSRYQWIFIVSTGLYP